MAENIDIADEEAPQITPRRGPAVVTVPPSGASIDIALLFGVVGAFALVLTALLTGGSIGAFYNAPALLIVFLGTFAVTTISFSLAEVTGAIGSMFRSIFPKKRDPARACERVLELSGIARDRGILALDAVLPQIATEAYLQKGIALAVDGATPEEIERVLANEIDIVDEHRLREAAVLRRAAEVAPAMGLIGTLVGLIQMLANLDDPSSIGPAMAVALLTTFYGAVMAYMVFAPIAAKLERNADEENLELRIYLAGAASIARLERPRTLETYLNTMLPPSRRLSIFE